MTQRLPKFSEGRLDVDKILRTLSLQPGQTVVDAGCGTGHMAAHFTRAVGPFGRVYAVDKDSQFINIARAERLESNLVVLQEDMTRATSIPPCSVDCIFAAAVIQIFSPAQLRDFLQEARRLLRPGGCLAIVTFEKKESNSGPLLHQRQSPEELQALIAWPAGETVRVSDELYMQIFIARGDQKNGPRSRTSAGPYDEGGRWA